MLLRATEDDEKPGRPQKTMVCPTGSFRRCLTFIIEYSMLVELLVENYAVVERIRVRFHPG